jgi:uncharacterized protein YggU (UPF0235/DUF167 family)
MKVAVKVIPHAKVSQVQKGTDGTLKVWLKSEPIESKANKELINIIAKYYSVKKNEIKIICGLTSKNKILKIGGKNEE